jgi:hypothetical protein
MSDMDMTTVTHPCEVLVDMGAEEVVVIDEDGDGDTHMATHSTMVNLVSQGRCFPLSR